MVANLHYLLFFAFTEIPNHFQYSIHMLNIIGHTHCQTHRRVKSLIKYEASSSQEHCLAGRGRTSVDQGVVMLKIPQSCCSGNEPQSPEGVTEPAPSRQHQAHGTRTAAGTRHPAATARSSSSAAYAYPPAPLGSPRGPLPPRCWPSAAVPDRNMIFNILMM